jgi:hypothetical protein
MKFSEIDWNVLKGAVVLFVIATLIAGFGLYFSQQFWSKQHRSLNRANNALVSSRRQYHTLDDEENIIATYLPRYAALEEEGIIGREHRLDWIDILRETARKSEIRSVEYVIEAQQPFDVGVDLGVKDYVVYASSMRLTLGLLHEGDLLLFLKSLNDNVPGLFGVTGCQMRRIGTVLSSNPRADNVSAICNLNFLTIRNSKSQPGAAS